MKSVCIIGALFCLLLGSGCEYEVPLSSKRAIYIDPSLLGTWVELGETGKPLGEGRRIQVSRLSETEYGVHFLSHETDAIRYRAYPIRVGRVYCIQIEAIGTDEKPLAPGDKPFHVVSCQRDGNELTVSVLNTDLVKSSITNSLTLRGEFLTNQDRKDLFRHPAKFLRVGDPPEETGSP